MLFSFDMNSHQILNLPTPVTPTDVVRLEDLQAAISALSPAPTPPVGSTFVYSSSYTTLPLADAAAAALGGPIVLNDHKTLTASYPLTCKGLIVLGGDITLGNFNLTFNNQYLIAGGVQVFKSTGSGLILGTILGNVCIDWWGTTSLTIADSATSLAGNSALTYSIQSAKTNTLLYCTKSDYYLSAPWVKPNSFNAPNFEGFGASLHYSFTSQGAIQYIGGSGSLPMAYVSGFTFVGTTSTANLWGFENDGQCGLDLRYCIFQANLAWGIVANNKASGAFTEYFQWYSCTFFSKQAWWFKIISGNQSFHGSGSRENVTINGPASAPGPLVFLDDAAVVYNAPSNFQAWVRDNAYAVVGMNGTPAQARYFTYGTISIENFSAGAVTIGSGNSYMLLCGQVLHWNGTPTLGNLKLMDSMAINNDGTVPGHPKAWKVTQALTSGTVTIPCAQYTDTQIIVDIEITGTNYIKKNCYKLWADGFGHAGLTSLTGGFEFSLDTDSHGTPAVSATEGNIVFNSSGMSGVPAGYKVVLSILPISGAF